MSLLSSQQDKRGALHHNKGWECRLGYESEVEDRPLVAPTSGGGGAQRAVVSEGGEGEGSVGSVEMGRRRKKGFQKDQKRVKILGGNNFSLIITKKLPCDT